MNKSQFYAEIENIVDRDPGSIKGTEALSELESWDSLAVLSFLAMADGKLGVSVNAGDLASCKTVEDLAALFPGKVV